MDMYTTNDVAGRAFLILLFSTQERHDVNYAIIIACYFSDNDVLLYVL